MTGVLPRSLDPLPDESLPGYLLRLAHRLDLPPIQLARTTGLAPPRRGNIPASSMLALPAATAAMFARHTRLDPAEVTALTLASLAVRYPPVDPHRSFYNGRQGRPRHLRGVFVKKNWVLSRSSRYCPQCLAGDCSPIQQQYGGAWSRLWRLPVVFACPVHHRLLEHNCPSCDRPALQRTIGGPLIPRQHDSALHPAQCRNPARDDHNRHPSPCATRLDRPNPMPTLPAGGDLAELLNLQTHLLNLLRHDAPPTTADRPATAAQYAVDLRVISCLVVASWPAARHLALTAAHAELVDDHVHGVREKIDKAHREGTRAHAYTLYDRPPADPATGAALIAVAHRLTQAASVTALRAELKPLLDNAPGPARSWASQFLSTPGYCSPSLKAALTPPAQRGPALRPPQPPHTVRFGPQHVPQRMPQDWIARYFTAFTDLNRRHLHRAIAARLCQMSLGEAITNTANRLGIPHRAITVAFNVVDRKLATTARTEAFDAALNALADHIDTIQHPIDYGQRRLALATWSIPATAWSTLVHGLPTHHHIYNQRRQIAWDDTKRTLASIWVWYTITHGDHIYAPPLRPDPNASSRQAKTTQVVLSRWPLMTHSPRGIYRKLRDRLTPYAERLATQIDANDRLPTDAVTTIAEK